VRSKASTYAAVGGFLGILLVAGYFAIVYVAKGMEGEGYKLVAYFSDATGLVEKSRVQIAGIVVGHISERRFVETPPRPELIREKRFARITVALPDDATIFENAAIYKKTASLLGEFYLEIDPGTATDLATGKAHRRLKPGDEILLVVGAVTSDDILRRVDDTLPTLKAIAEDIRELTRPEGPLPSIARNLNQSIAENKDTLRNVMLNLEGITGDVRNVTRGADKDVRVIVDDVKSITSAIRELVGTGDEEVRATTGKVKMTLDKLSTAIEKLDRALGNVADITGGVKAGEGNLGRLVKDEALIDSVERAAEDTGELIRGITRLQTIVGLRTEYNVLANTIKSYVAVQLQPRPDKYFLIELVQDPRGSRHVTQSLETTTDPNRPQRVFTETVEVEDKLRFSFQFAKRLNFSRSFASTVRFGIKESTGGVGADVHLFRNRLEIQNDLFDPVANRFPRLKSLFAFEFFKHMYVVGGVDDILNDRPQIGAGGGRDYFAGAQLKFNDEDLRGMLFVGGAAVGAAANN
jgi:phospholipid/cholesterol/gamma-HCH transport system substrate-binding protein